MSLTKEENEVIERGRRYGFSPNDWPLIIAISWRGSFAIFLRYGVGLSTPLARKKSL